MLCWPPCVSFSPIRDGPPPRLPQLWAVPQTSRKLVLKPGALPPGRTFTLRITASEGAGAAFADVTVATGVPPRGRSGATGDVVVSMTSGVAMATSFNISTSGWVSSAPPISYRFSYVADGSSSPEEMPLTDWSPFPWVVAKLPAGYPEFGSRVTVSVRARSALRAVSAAASATVVVQWAPVATQGPGVPPSVSADPSHQLLLGSPQLALGGVVAVVGLLDTLNTTSGADGAEDRAATRVSLIQARAPAASLALAPCAARRTLESVPTALSLSSARLRCCLLAVSCVQQPSQPMPRALFVRCCCHR